MEREITGFTKHEHEGRAQEFYESSKYAERGLQYEEVFCLAKIPQSRQPDDYGGSQRFCGNYSVQHEEDPESADEIAPKCRFHGGANTSKTANGDVSCLKVNQNNKPTYIKHGMYSVDEHLKEDFTENDRKLFDFIMSWGDTYGIGEDDPATRDILQQLAVERVRAVRSAKYLLEGGETDDTPVFDNQGNLVERQDVSSALSEVHQRQRKLIISMMKELGLTPKERSNIGVNESEASAADAIADVAKNALSSDKGSYDPSDYEEE